jgi:glycosyltransferase involved in cell wall biosynthesis
MPSSRPIVFVTPYYPPYGAGGAERTAALHAGILVRSGQPVVVVTPDFGPEPAGDSEDGVTVQRIDIGHRLVQGRQIPERRFEFGVALIRLADAAERVAADTDALCIHAQHPAVAAAGAKAAERRRLPFVAHVRDTGMICSTGGICLMEKGVDAPPHWCSYLVNMACRTGRWNRVYDVKASVQQQVSALVRGTGSYLRFRSRGRYYATARRIAFASQGLLDLYAQRADFADRSRLRVVYAPVIDRPDKADATRLPAAVQRILAEGRPLILFVGKVSRGKGADVMFAAFHKLAASHPEARLVVCGNFDPTGWDFDQSRTIALGFVDQATLAALYDACTIVLLPSTWPEPLGWATLDAGRHAKPIVATRVGGIPEAVIDGKTGLLVRKADAGAMAEALESLLDHPEVARELGQAARRHVRSRFGEAAVAEQLRALYAGLG